MTVVASQFNGTFFNARHHTTRVSDTDDPAFTDAAEVVETGTITSADEGMTKQFTPEELFDALADELETPYTYDPRWDDADAAVMDDPYIDPESLDRIEVTFTLSAVVVGYEDD